MIEVITVHVAADPIDATVADSGYDVHVGRGLLDRLADFIPLRGGTPDMFAIVGDRTTDALFGDRAEAALRPVAPCVRIVFDGGEEHKSLDSLGRILEAMAAAHLTRKSVVVALGGGIVGDVAGFAAAAYMRGVRCVQVPTTLVAAVDSSVGGKTAINLAAGKNLAGAFHQPSAVIMDADTLKTLDDYRIADGVAEALKHGILRSRKLFDSVASGHACEPETIAENVRIKAAVVAEDAHENGVRKILNLGHTFGHAIEKCSNFEVSHGHAVAAGVCMASRAARAMGKLSDADCAAIVSGVASCGLPTTTDLKRAALVDAMLSDKKRAGGSVDFILPVRIGEVTIERTPVEDISRMLDIALDL